MVHNEILYTIQSMDTDESPPAWRLDLQIPHDFLPREISDDIIQVFAVSFNDVVDARTYCGILRENHPNMEFRVAACALTMLPLPVEQEQSEPV